MDILIYTHVFPPMVGGIETITMELAQGLSGGARPAHDDAVQITLVTPKEQAAPHENELPFRIVRKPSVLQLARLIRSAGIVHVAGTDMLPLLLGWLFRKRVVVEHHAFQTACPNGQMFYQSTQVSCPGHFMAGNYLQCLKCNSVRGVAYSAKRLLLTFPRRWLCTRAKANVVPTRWLGTVLKLPNLVTIHHGLDMVENPVAARNAGPRRIVFIGRLVSTKGVHILLQAVHQLRGQEFQLDIVGDGPERARLEADVQLLGLQGRVIFRGSLVGDERERALEQAAMVVMPSLCETFGLVALENMARKKVLIASDIGPLAEVIGDAGLTFPAGDASALARCIQQVLQSDELAEQIAERAFQRANSLFTTEHMVDEHRQLYYRVFGAPPHGHLSLAGKES